MFKSRKYKKLASDYEQLKIEYKKVTDRLVTLLWEKDKFNLPNQLLEKYQILGIAENKLGQKYYVCLRIFDDSLEIYLRDSKRTIKNPRILTKVVDKGNEEKSCFITDMFAIEENVGNGSILLTNLIDYVKRMGVKKLSGILSPEDEADFEKLKYFYRKNGFNITFNPTKGINEIEMYF